MIQSRFTINNIPAVLWGEKSDKVMIAVHGNMSNKEDTPIKMLADQAISKGYQVVSFDLPEHGDRKMEGIPCKAQICVEELEQVMQYTKSQWNEISLFANSMGAYFSLLAYKDSPIQKAWFLSPLVDMRRMIENMMMWFQISEEQLEKEQTIATPIGQNLYWDYYSYVKENPVNIWNVPTSILYGTKDDTCEFNTISEFVDKFSAELQIAQDAEHYFHTKEQLRQLEDWLEKVVE